MECLETVSRTFPTSAARPLASQPKATKERADPTPGQVSLSPRPAGHLTNGVNSRPRTLPSHRLTAPADSSAGPCASGTGAKSGAVAERGQVEPGGQGTCKHGPAPKACHRFSCFLSCKLVQNRLKETKQKTNKPHTFKYKFKQVWKLSLLFQYFLKTMTDVPLSAPQGGGTVPGGRLLCRTPLRLALASAFCTAGVVSQILMLLLRMSPLFHVTTR